MYQLSSRMDPPCGKKKYHSSIRPRTIHNWEEEGPLTQRGGSEDASALGGSRIGGTDAKPVSPRPFRARKNKSRWKRVKSRGGAASMLGPPDKRELKNFNERGGEGVNRRRLGILPGGGDREAVTEKIGEATSPCSNAANFELYQFSRGRGNTRQLP